MGNNQKSLLINNIKSNNTNTEGTQNLMTTNSDKKSKKNAGEIIFKEKNRNKNMYSKRESVDVLLTKNNLNTIPTENNEVLKQNNINIRNNIISYKNKNLEENKTIDSNEKESKNSLHEIEISKNDIKSKKEIKKIEFNNITIIDNLSNYFPKNISKKEIDEIVDLSLDGYIKEDKSEYMPGQNLTSEQADALKQIIYDNISKNQNFNNNDYSILDKINAKIWMSELNKDIIEKMFFQGKKISKIQNDIIIKKLSKGKKNVKALVIELL